MLLKEITIAIFLLHSSSMLAGCKEEIQVLSQKIKNTPTENASLLEKDLAVLYTQDQELEKAFDAFIASLKHVASPISYSVSPEEEKIYQEALALYLSMPDRNIAIKLLQDYGHVLKSHPEYHQLGFIIAAAYANLDQFTPFFKLFYPSYLALPTHYLAYKGKASLHAQLFARRHLPAEREIQRNAILENLTQAIQQFPRDPGLYRMLLTFAPNNTKIALLNSSMDKIIAENIILPRADILFYVEMALEAEQKELASRMINKGLEWYPESRALKAQKSERING